LAGKTIDVSLFLISKLYQKYRCKNNFKLRIPEIRVGKQPRRLLGGCPEKY
jgi:hypothetical protein